ncbi:cold-regulated 47 [Artemisia annua]|uniref:Cold-regulated 47 n=1 Tax=Artemisia annua TaxID=35608 RepID=A0A2U1QGK8_ARTAN|nr:cold-regulated 47 [Artemisia annua]
MSDEAVYHHATKSDNETKTDTVEQSDRGLFDFMGKKDEEKKCEETAISSEFETKAHVSEPEPKSEEKKESLLSKLHRSDSSSSSSSDEEECEDGEKKKKKKKPLKETIKEKIEEHKEKKEEQKIEDTHVPVEKYEEVPVAPPIGDCVTPVPTPEPEEKKGFMEKIKEKLPGGHKKTEEEHYGATPPAPPVEAAPPVVTHDAEGEPKEKKGIFEKIKEKIPGEVIDSVEFPSVSRVNERVRTIYFDDSPPSVKRLKVDAPGSTIGDLAGFEASVGWAVRVGEGQSLILKTSAKESAENGGKLSVPGIGISQGKAIDESPLLDQSLVAHDTGTMSSSDTRDSGDVSPDGSDNIYIPQWDVTNGSCLSGPLECCSLIDSCSAVHVCGCSWPES